MLSPEGKTPCSPGLETGAFFFLPFPSVRNSGGALPPGRQACLEKAFLTQHSHGGCFSGSEPKLCSPRFMQTLNKADFLPPWVKSLHSRPGLGMGVGGSLWARGSVLRDKCVHTEAQRSGLKGHLHGKASGFSFFGAKHSVHREHPATPSAAGNEETQCDPVALQPSGPVTQPAFKAASRGLSCWEDQPLCSPSPP